jgi:hypothetical protein
MVIIVLKFKDHDKKFTKKDEKWNEKKNWSEKTKSKKKMYKIVYNVNADLFQNEYSRKKKSQQQK